MTPERFTIILESTPSPTPVYCRLRRLLKVMLRGYGFRAVDVREAVPAVQVQAVAGSLRCPLPRAERKQADRPGSRPGTS